MMCAEVIKDGVDRRYRSEVDQLLRVSEHIRELTEDSRKFIETLVGEAEVEAEPVSLDKVLGDEVRKSKSKYPEVTITVNGLDGDVTVMGNKMLSSVFRNLLSNAVQHNDGDPEIDIDIDSKEEEVEVKVADNGPGIPDDKKERIFQDGEVNESEVGMGLYLVHNLVHSFDGEVHISDNQPKGTTFTVRLLAPS